MIIDHLSLAVLGHGLLLQLPEVGEESEERGKPCLESPR